MNIGATLSQISKFGYGYAIIYIKDDNSALEIGENSSMADSGLVGSFKFKDSNQAFELVKQGGAPRIWSQGPLYATVLSVADKCVIVCFGYFQSKLPQIYTEAIDLSRSLAADWATEAEDW